MAEATGVVLAGGRSTRYGRDKLAEPYRGAPLLHHALLRLGEVCSEVVVVLSPHAAEPAAPAGVPVRFTRDVHEGEGPLAGLHAGLTAAVTDVVLVAAGDMPDLQTRVLLEILRVLDRSSVAAVALRDGHRFRPLPCGVRRGPAVDAARAMLDAGGRRLRDVLDALEVSVIDESAWTALDPERRTLFDVDEPSDLTR